MIVIFKNNLYTNNGFLAKLVPWVTGGASARPPEPRPCCRGEQPITLLKAVLKALSDS